MTVIPGRRIVGRPGIATRVQGRCEGRASATPSRLLPSVGAAGDRCLSCTRAPFGASAPMGRQRIRLPIRIRQRLLLSKGRADFLSLYRCSEAQEGQQRSIDRDVQRSRIRGKVCSWQGSRPEFSDWRQRRCNFGPHLCGRYPVQSDEHLRGHPYFPRRRQCRSRIPILFCHPLYGPCDRQSVARSVGECLNDIIICSMCRCRYTHAGSEHEYMRRHEHSCIHISCCLLGSRFF